MSLVLERSRNWLLGIWTFFALLYLFIPIFIVALFSFNDPKGRFNLTWQGFTLDHWLHPFAIQGVGNAVKNSIEIAAISTLIALVLGTFVALAMTRYRVKGHGTLDLFIFLPLATPEVVLGAALLGLFLTMSVVTGFATIVIAHVMFNLSYVVVTIRARLEGMDTHMEEAAMDLGANEWTTFRKVTLPLIAPGIAAAGLLAFAISFDDFVITNFNAGQTLTFPLYIWGAARQGVPPEVNVIATALLVIAVGFMALNLVIQRRLARRDAAVREEPEPAPALGVAPGSALAG
jgi:spermidine/putrescine transport system permease protein